MSTIIDLTGQRFGNLVVLGNPQRKNSHTYWDCICDCGKTISTTSNALRRGRAKSCGCSRKTRWDVEFEKEYAGKKFGRLTPVKRIHCSENEHGRPFIECICDCGKTTRVSATALKAGSIKSCGCYNREGSLKPGATHMLSGTRLYRIWENMIARCENRNSDSWKNYGGRGISICSEWRNDFLSFYNWAISHGYDDSLTIDRIDNDKGYEPNNCQFLSRSENTKKMLREKASNRERVIADGIC